MSLRHFVADNAEAIGRGLEGFCALHADLVALHRDPRYVVRAEPAVDKVALVSGGGSGHEPLHAGFVGVGMLDAAVPGEVFASPSALQVRAATRAVDTGKGVLHIVKNYTGDVINFRLAAEACRSAGVEVATVIVDDDVPSAVRGSTPGRRGTVATVVVEKVCGAAAEAGLGLTEVQALGQRVVDASRSVGVALSAGRSYGSGESTFDLADDELEYGVGIHGERGTDRITREPLDALVTRCLDTLAQDGDGLAGPQLLIVNGLGSTTPLELTAAYGVAASQLAERGIPVVRAMVGDLVTSLGMHGLSITLVAMDDELLGWWDATATTPSWAGAVAAPAVEPTVRTEAEAAEQAEAAVTVDPAVSAWAQGVLDTIAQWSSALGELDRLSGDGDFGDNLATAAERARLDDGGHPLIALSDAFAGIGGSSGPMLAVWFSAMARHLGTGIDAAAVAAALSDGVEAVRELGGAEPGDRTMVDAMAPAAETAAETATQAADGSGGSTGEVVRAAASAARRGADRTSELVARKGRASYLGDTVTGAPDPGAVAVALFLDAATKAFT